MDLESKIRVIEDFPEEGISFKDITTLTQDKDAFNYAVKSIADNLRDKKPDYIVGPEARGFIFGAAVAYELGVGFVQVRKKGRLPYEVLEIEYDLEYGSNILEMHVDAIEPNSKVAIVDDLLATGGTVAAVAKLLDSHFNAEIVGLEFLIELESLKAREELKEYEVNSLVKYDI